MSVKSDRRMSGFHRSRNDHCISPLVRRSAKTDASAVLECLDLKMADDQMMGLEYEYMMYNTESTDEKNEGESKR